MIRVNISQSPLSVTLFNGDELVEHYSGALEDILNKLVKDSYNIGVESIKIQLETDDAQIGSE